MELLLVFVGVPTVIAALAIALTYAERRFRTWKLERRRKLVAEQQQRIYAAWAKRTVEAQTQTREPEKSTLERAAARGEVRFEPAVADVVPMNRHQRRKLAALKRRWK